MTARRLAVPLVIMLVLTGCSTDERARRAAPPIASGASSAPPATATAQAKEGWFGSPDGLHARVEILGVERQGRASVLRYAVTSLDGTPKSVPFGLTLLDPVGRKLYRPARPAAPETFAPGGRRTMTAQFPAIPPQVEKLTVITPGTAGEYTGVPVTGTGTTAPAGLGENGNPADLYDIAEGEAQDVIASVSDVRIDLHADALFAADSARLSGRAKQILDQTAREIGQRADPRTHPITISGHTDSEGDAADNLTLSRERAQTVFKGLRSRLRDAFVYSPVGKGETEPVAKEGGRDDARARARNRRVALSYAVKNEATGTPSTPSVPTSPTSPTFPVTSPSAPAAPTVRGTGRPAGFRARDGNTVASTTGRFGRARRRLDVKPFYRDGAYVVAVFDLVNEGPGSTPPNAAYAHEDYPGGAFTAFSVRTPGGKDVYRAVRIGPPATGTAAYVDPGRATFRTAVGQPARAFVYFPAPPGNPASLVFDAGPFGTVDNVPLR